MAEVLQKKMQQEVDKYKAIQKGISNKCVVILGFCKIL